MELNQNLSSKSDSIENPADTANPGDISVSMIAKKRQRHEPQRFGHVGYLDLSDSYDDVMNLLDNSLDDENFVPEESTPKVVATATDLSKRILKKKKVVSPRERIRENTIDNYLSKSQQPVLNLDDEFDSIAITLPKIVQINEHSQRRRRRRK